MEQANTPKERADVERQYRADVSGLDRTGRQRQYEQEMQDRRNRFQRFGAKGMQDSDNVLPPQKLPQENDLLNKPQTNQEKATQEVQRSVDKVGETMQRAAQGFETIIAVAGQLQAFAESVGKDMESNQRDADSMAQDISSLRIV